MQKNQDQLNPDLADVIRNSSRAHVKLLAPASSSKTLGFQFKTQLKDLMTTLHSTSPHFIRCIKSNNIKVSDTFDAPMILRQLRYSGLKEVVNIRQLGYPIRRLHTDFIDRYLKLAPDAKAGDDKATVSNILGKIGVDASSWRVGDTKVFYRGPVQQKLEKDLEKYLRKVALALQNLGRAKVHKSFLFSLPSVLVRLVSCMPSSLLHTVFHVLMRCVCLSTL